MLLALFGHPDDEFAVFPWLRSARREGREVHAIYLSDGALRGASPVRREQETLRALASLGVDAAHVHFHGVEWGVPDGTVHLHLDRIVPALCDRHRERASAGTVLIPAWEGGHQDHDATHLAGLALARAAGALRVEQYPVYHGAGLPGPLFRVLSPLEANGTITAHPTAIGERLGSVLRCFHYVSQWRSFLGLLPFYALRMCWRRPFVIQPVDPARTAVRPHPGPTLYERRGGPSWEGFAEATRSWRAG